ncbi:Nucleic-acid-binding protein from transposon X-element [Eumeta japonica]|uniref:Nucleic-acid-binding protein from transposon X-element n=1 Tax=Eumeta variegata TaxID=151549 RepID=A0A4C1Y3F0_EUMVA|nr:Nucleic-acid-binding protein from transposon X-element [Eumeta japonica]
MSDIWIRRRRFGSAQCSIAEAGSARYISANIFACIAYCRDFITDERPRTNLGGKKEWAAREGRRLMERVHGGMQGSGQPDFSLAGRKATAKIFTLRLYSVVFLLTQAIKPRPPFLRDLTARLRCVKVISYLYRSWLLGLPSRQRSSSLTDLGMVTQNHQTAITVPVNETSISREVMSQEDNHYIAPPPWQRVPNHPSDETCSSNVIKPSKPPPIVLNGIEDVNELSKLLQTASDKVNFKFKLINKNLLHILVSSAEEYKKIITTIRAKGLIGHTFTPKDTKCYRVVIKDLHHSTPMMPL